MAAYLNANDADFGATVLKSDVPVLVDFWAPWCGPCRALSPHVEAIAEEFVGRAKVVKVNVDDCQGIATQFGIRGIPTLLLFKDGEPVEKLVGMPGNTRERLRKMIEGAL